MKRFDFILHQSSTVSENALPARPYSLFNNVTRKDLKSWKIAGFKKLNKELLTVAPTKRIKVPSNVQFYGLDFIQYTNHTYPFPYNPPYIDIDNPCYVYVTNYSVKSLTKEHVINFEGVDSCLYLFVNNHYIGYASISHRHVEFLLNDYLKKGDNEIRVVVFKWNFNSYLEDQDKIRLTGIFRDVYVLERARGYLKDYDLKTVISQNSGTLFFTSEQKVDLVFYDGSKIIEKVENTDNTAITIQNPRLWTAETPYIYKLIITCRGEEIAESVGFREFTVEEGVLKLNGAPIKLKGINRHSFTLNGYVEDASDLERDLKILKATNINAIRTAHYPPHPLLPYYCDKYGFYLMVEADLESHGSTMASGEYNLADYSLVSKMPEYYEQIIARSLLAYQSVKNRPSLFSFSLGNEAGYSKALIDAADKLHALNKSLLVHYETVFHSDNKDEYYNNNLDFYSRMYADPEWCENHVLTHKDKPFILCEYTHSMGNSIGDAADYQKLIDQYPHFAGAFVWEFISQSIRVEGKDLYGGDFGEIQHDGNFCVDGVVEIDRTFTPQMYDLKEVFAPIDFYKKNNEIYILNKYDFLNLHNFTFKLYGLTLTGEVLLKEENFPDTLPKEVAFIAKVHDVFVSYRLEMTEGKRVISVKQVINKYLVPKYQASTIKTLTIENGLIKELIINDTVLKNMRLHVYRPPIDNEMHYAKLYEEVGIKDASFELVESKNNNHKFNLIAKNKLLGIVTINYEAKKTLAININAKFNHGLPFLQRFGLSFDVGEAKLSYFGYGPHESYIDRHQGTTLNLYELHEKNNYRYIKPQASGNHYGVYYVTINDLTVTSIQPFETSVDNIDIYNYPTHRHLLQTTKTRTLYIDYKQSGVGSYSVGPELDKKYRLDEKEVEFTVFLGQNRKQK